jgi:acetolactate synthase-1/2/3 large subunit
MWVAKFYPVYGNNTLLISNGFASMGFALPAAIGAKLLYPHRKVVAVCGDGGFLMNVQELETACRMGLNVVVIVFRDGGYDLIKWKNARKFGDAQGLDFSNPDFVKLAESFGARGLAVTSSDGMEQLLAEALSGKGPVVVDVPIDYTGHELLAGLL